MKQNNTENTDTNTEEKNTNDDDGDNDDEDVVHYTTDISDEQKQQRERLKDELAQFKKYKQSDNENNDDIDDDIEAKGDELVKTKSLMKPTTPITPLNMRENFKKTSVSVYGNLLSPRKSDKMYDQITTQKPIKSSNVFNYESDFDENGIIHWLGLNKGKSDEWINPMQRGLCKAYGSPLAPDCASWECLFGKELVRFTTVKIIIYYIAKRIILI